MPTAPPQRGSCDETFARLLAAGVTPRCAARRHHVAARRAGAHRAPDGDYPADADPEASAHRRGAGAQDRVDLTAPERADIVASLRREILAAWETDEIRARRPTPVDEAIAGLLIFEQTLWDAVPRFLRSLERRADARHRPRPSRSKRRRFDSDRGWAATATATPRSRPRSRAWRAVWRDGWRPTSTSGKLRRSARSCRSRSATPELRARANGAREPYRAVLRDVRDRLRATRESLGGELSRAALLKADSERLETGPRTSLSLDCGIRRAAAALLPLARRRPGRTSSPSGRLTDVLRRTAAFGLTLVRLDLRQHAARHAEALDAITRHRGLGSYLEWDESQRQSFLAAALRDHQPLAPPDFEADDDVREVLDTFELAGRA